jgi:ribosomal protein RSM22 (predicted rRNA methylase)
VLQRAEANVPTGAGYSRIVGAPRQFKGYSKVLSCQAEGVRELVLQKRDAPELFRTLRRGKAGTVYRWTLRDGKIAAGTLLGEQDH